MWKDLNNNKDDKTCSKLESDAEENNQSKDNTNILTALSSAEFRRAMLKITLADLTMSLDNVLAVAGIARENIFILVFWYSWTIIFN